MIELGREKWEMRLKRESSFLKYPPLNDKRSTNKSWLEPFKRRSQMTTLKQPPVAVAHYSDLSLIMFL